MSTSEEIQSVFEDEIAQKTKIVANRFGKSPFYDKFLGCHIEEPFLGLGTEEIICSDFTPKSKKRGKCR